MVVSVRVRPSAPYYLNDVNVNCVRHNKTILDWLRGGDEC